MVVRGLWDLVRILVITLVLSSPAARALLLA